jgi:hypothetical protein
MKKFIENIIEAFNTFKKMYEQPDHITVATNELRNAKREYLQALSAKEYAASLATYHAGRIKRIEAYLAKNS